MFKLSGDAVESSVFSFWLLEFFVGVFFSCCEYTMPLTFEACTGGIELCIVQHYHYQPPKFYSFCKLEIVQSNCNP